jgi:hypothetical protein
MFARETAAFGKGRLCAARKKDKANDEREDRQGPLVALFESKNAIDGNEAARDDGRMTAWLWIDT